MRRRSPFTSPIGGRHTDLISFLPPPHYPPISHFPLTSRYPISPLPSSVPFSPSQLHIATSHIPVECHFPHALHLYTTIVAALYPPRLSLLVANRRAFPPCRTPPSIAYTLFLASSFTLQSYAVLHLLRSSFICQSHPPPFNKGGVRRDQTISSLMASVS